MLAGLLAAAACDDTTLPGTQLGTYGVTGTQTSNTCGAGVNAPATPWTFDATMSESGTTLYWNDAVNGTLSGALVDSTASMTTSVQGNVDGTNGVNGPCNMERDLTIDVTLASGSPPGTFAGTLTYSFSVVAPSTATDCSDQLSVNGGTYDVLPCSFAYSLTGSLQ